MVLSWLRRWHQARCLRRFAVPEHTWRHVLADEPILWRLDQSERAQLRRLATLLIATKHFAAVGDHTLDTYQTARIAAVTALLVLRLDLGWLRAWRTVVLYPGEFNVTYAEADAVGVVHEGVESRVGEAWHGGPVVLSWADVVASAAMDGFHVVVHEMAHQLDGLDGSTNGRPPLHRDMLPAGWATAFEACFADLTAREKAGAATPIDAYASQDPAECFAVCTEAFFQTPGQLQAAYPAVYDQLRQFYRQDPRQSLMHGGGQQWHA